MTIAGSDAASRLFVGRMRELGELRAGLDDALSGRGRTFLVCGEPGIGKTRLADELSGQPSAAGARALWGRSWEEGGAPAYWLWVQVFRALLAALEPSDLAAALPSGAGYLAQIVPELARLGGGTTLPSSASLESEHARFFLFDAATSFLKNASRSTPLVIVLDDLHAADRPSLFLLRFLAREIRDSRILVAGLYREAEVRRAPDLADLFGTIAREGETISLGGLGEADVRSFVSGSTGLAPTDSLVALVHRRTEGNPLFLREVVRMLQAGAPVVEHGEADAPRFQIPEGIRAAIRARLRSLSSDARESLSVAAVIGQEFELSLLERSADLSAERLLAAIDELRATGIVAEAPPPAGCFRFSHSLVRETLYADLPSARRLELHRAIGETLEGRASADPEQSLPKLAHHFFEAALAGGGTKAIEYARAAGACALRLLAYEEAARLYQMSLAALDLRSESDAQERSELLLALGEAQRKAGDVERSNQTFLRAAELSRKLHSPDRLARAALGYGANYPRPQRLNQPVVDLLEEALRALGEEPTALRAEVLARLARQLYWSPSPERRRALSEEALRIARAVGDRTTLARALDARYWGIWGAEHLEERLAIASEILRLAEETGDKEMALAGHDYRFMDLLEQGDMAAVDVELGARARLAASLRLPLHRWHTPVSEAMRALLAGTFERAESLVQEALDLGLRAKEPTAVQTAGMQMLLLRREQGRLEEVEAGVRIFVEQHPHLHSTRALLAMIHAELGLEAEARRELEGLAEYDFLDLPEDLSRLFTLSQLAQVCSRLGDRDHAATLYRLLAPYAGRSVTVAGAACVGAAAHYLGLLAVTLGRDRDAETHFESAIALAARMGAAAWVVHGRAELGMLWLASADASRHARGAALLGEVVTDARARGMVALAARVEARLAGLGAEVEARLSRAVGEAEGSRATPRNHKVVRLHAKGKREAGQVPAEKGVFRREGDYWTIVRRESALRLKDTKGLRYIAHLLRHAGEEISCLDLVRAVEGGGFDPEAPRMSGAEAARSGLSVTDLGDAGELLDGDAKVAYRARIDELRAELEEARSFNDPGRAARAEEEIEFLTRELLAAVGLGGRDRRAASASERARVRVARAIALAIRNVSEYDAALGRFFATAIRTGRSCRYEPQAGVEWRL